MSALIPGKAVSAHCDMKTEGKFSQTSGLTIQNNIIYVTSLEERIPLFN